jgi:hypothetical protein
VLEPAARIGIVILYNTGDLDPYTSVANITVTNNALRILKNLPLSNFGVPRQSDPTLNNYLAVKENTEKFLGIYLAKSGKRLDIKRGGSEGLKLYFMESIYPADFDVDFVNESNFIARNISANYSGYFTANAQGEVQAINFSGEVFRRKNAETTGMKQYKVKSSGMSFLLPESWQISLGEKGFIAKAQKDNDAELSNTTTKLSYEEWLLQVKQQALQKNVTEMTEFKNGYFFQSMVYLDQKGYRHITLYCAYRGKNYIFTLKDKPENITHLAMSVLNPFLSSLSLR